MNETLFVIDGLSQIYRAYYAQAPPMTSPDGVPTNATHVFLNMLARLIRDRRPDYLVMALEGGEGGTDFRREAYPAYKSNRSPMPDDLRPQVKQIESIVNALGIPVLRLPGFEADDLMATIVERMSTDEPKLDIHLVSADKDLRQLLSAKTRLFDPRKGTELDAEALFDQHGYTPQEAVEVQILAGDSTDNIPGVRGIGMKTAAKLIRKYGSADGVLAYADALTPKQQENVRAFASQMQLTRQLVTLRCDAPLDFRLEDCVLDLDIDAAQPLLETLGLAKLQSNLAALVAGLPR